MNRKKNTHVLKLRNTSILQTLYFLPNPDTLFLLKIWAFSICLANINQNLPWGLWSNVVAMNKQICLYLIASKYVHIGFHLLLSSAPCKLIALPLPFQTLPHPSGIGLKGKSNRKHSTVILACHFIIWILLFRFTQLPWRLEGRDTGTNARSEAIPIRGLSQYFWHCLLPRVELFDNLGHIGYEL